MLIGYPCVFHLLTGLYCPGCGGTRAVKHLLQGHFTASFQYHPFVIYAVITGGLVMLFWLMGKIKKKSYLQVRHYSIILYTGLAIFVVNCLVKNYYLVVKGIDLLP